MKIRQDDGSVASRFNANIWSQLLLNLAGNFESMRNALKCFVTSISKVTRKETGVYIINK